MLRGANSSADAFNRVMSAAILGRWRRMNEQQWYYADDGEQRGPVATAELKRLLGSGRVSADELVWCEGMDDWQPATQVAGLLPEKKKPRPVGKSPRPVKPAPRDEEEAAAPRTGADRFDAGPSIEESPASPAVESPTPSDKDLSELGFPGSGADSAGDDAPDEPMTFHTQRPGGLGPRGPQRTVERVVERVVVVNGDSQGRRGIALAQLGLWLLCGLAMLAVLALFVSNNLNSPTSEIVGPLRFVAWMAAIYILAKSGERGLQLLGRLLSSDEN